MADEPPGMPKTEDSPRHTYTLWQKMPWLSEHVIARILKRVEHLRHGQPSPFILPQPPVDIYDSTGLTHRAVPNDAPLDSFSAGYPSKSSRVIGSDREHALRRIVKDTLDKFRDQGWHGNSRTRVLVENYRRYGFKEVTCVLCSQPISANPLLLADLNRRYEQDPQSLPAWTDGMVEDGEFWNPSDVAGAKANFDHMGPKARRNSGLALSETHDRDPHENMRWCELKERVPVTLDSRYAGRRPQAEMLQYAREYTRRHPKVTVRELRSALRQSFEPMLRELYNHPHVIGVTHPTCNSKDGGDYGNVRHKASRTEILRRWQLGGGWREHEPETTDRAR